MPTLFELHGQTFFLKPQSRCAKVGCLMILGKSYVYNFLWKVLYDPCFSQIPESVLVKENLMLTRWKCQSVCLRDLQNSFLKP